MLNRKIFNIIQIGNKEDVPSRAFDIFIVIVIFMNISVLFLETFESMSRYSSLFKVVEIATVLVFCVEYILRIWTAHHLYPTLSRGKAILRFILSFDGIIDLLTIIPAFFLSGFVVFRMLRVARIFHLFRINVQSDSFNVIMDVIIKKRNQLLSSLFIIIILMLASSLFMYNVEHEAQPDVFKNAFSGIWWSVSTVLTVGYGDIYPVTVLGRAMATIIAFLGVGAVAIPTGIISAGFVTQYTMEQTALSQQSGPDNIIEIVVDNNMAGKAVTDVFDGTSRSCLLVVRNNISILPQPGLIFEAGDVAIVCEV